MEVVKMLSSEGKGLDYWRGRYLRSLPALQLIRKCKLKETKTFMTFFINGRHIKRVGRLVYNLPYSGNHLSYFLGRPHNRRVKKRSNLDCIFHCRRIHWYSLAECISLNSLTADFRLMNIK